MAKSPKKSVPLDEDTDPAPLRIAVGSDQVGHRLKEHLVGVLREDRHTVKDHGSHQNETLEIATIAQRVGLAVLQGDADVGILVSSSGAAATMIANKLVGIRAVHCSDTYTARQSRAQYDANVLGLGARVLGDDLAEEIAGVWVRTPFSEDERTVRRLAEIARLEEDRVEGLRPARLRRE